MSKFNDTRVKARNTAVGPIKTKTKKTTVTHEGGQGYLRNARSELFLLAVSNMVGEASYYETADARDDRYAKLIRKMAVKDGEWTAQLLAWLRGPEANMRSASLVGAAEYVKARLDAGIAGDNRRVISSVLQRADEPGEMLAYWVSHYGRKIPQPVKRGVADAAVRLYNERSLLKYDTSSHGFRFGDVIDLTHPVAKGEWQSDLFRHALDRRHNRDNPFPVSLELLDRNHDFKQASSADIERMAGDGTLAEVLADAGMTWEQLGSFGAWTAARWEAMIPSMGVMALLRNLRNFDQAGVSDKVAMQVAAKLADPEQVARSRQLPMRFLSAYNAAPSLRWAYPLEQALEHSLTNVPKLSGRTLILVDTSGSMNDVFSKDGTLRRWDAAAVFGLALARRCENADVISYSDRGIRFEHQPGESLLKALDRWKNGGYFIGRGTATAAITQAAFDKHDRVVILTDEQAGGWYGYGGDPGTVLPKTTPLYTWNLAGYQAGHAESGEYRHTFGGLTDAGFRLIPLLEAGRSGTWPWISGAE